MSGLLVLKVMEDFPLFFSSSSPKMMSTYGKPHPRQGLPWELLHVKPSQAEE